MSTNYEDRVSWKVNPQWDDQNQTFLAFERLLPQPVRRISTHASMVFLAGDKAYKLKRAVRYPYLDYSTPEKREVACQREFAINVVMAPDLYLKVTPIIVNAQGEVTLDGNGQPIDWAIVMRRFDDQALLSEQVSVGSLTREMVIAATDQIAEFHEKSAPVLVGQDHGGGSAGFAAVLDETVSGIIEQGPDDMKPVLSRASAQLSAFLMANKEALDRRMQDGLVRRCHGDLHLANIALFQGRPTLFDAVEFNDRISNIDVLYDVAFFWMDLIARGRTDLANLSLNRYLALRGRHYDIGLLPLFLSTRALIRARVALSRRAFLPDMDRQNCVEEARAYLNMADRLITIPKPCLVAAGGLSGCGKTSLSAGLAPEIAPAPGAVHLRSDEIRKALFNVDAMTPLPTEAYQPAVSRRVYDRMLRQAAEILNSGWSVVVDATFLSKQDRDLAMRCADDTGVGFVGLWLDAPLDIRQARIGDRTNDASDADQAVAECQRMEGTLGRGWHQLDAQPDLPVVVAQARDVVTAIRNSDKDEESYPQGRARHG